MATNFLLKRSGTASKRPDGASMALGELDLNYDASTGGVFYKDSSGNVVKVGPAQVGATAPNASPAGSAGNSVGEFWYDTGASALKIWNGTTWVTTGGGGGGGSGTVTDITAGTGLTGGTITTSGTISLDTACVIQPTLLTAKGSLISASAASTPVALDVGSDGQVLTACSACPLGVAWASGGGGGGGASPATPTIEGTVFGCTTGGQTSLGYSALSCVTCFGTGVNVAIGINALEQLTGDCSWNVGVGPFASRYATTAEYNTALGTSALSSTTSGSFNTAVGSSALGNYNGSYNIGLGVSAGGAYTGNCSIIIGNNVSPPSEDDSQLIIWSGSNHWIHGRCDGAIKFGGGIVDAADSCGTAGQVLTASGGNSYAWCSPATGATGTFTSQEGCTITVTNGLITSIV